MFDAFGNERPATEAELLAELNAPDVRHDENGRTIVYYHGQPTDITDSFTDGVCYVKLVHDEEEIYMTVTDHGYATSHNHFIDGEDVRTNR